MTRDTRVLLGALVGLFGGVLAAYCVIRSICLLFDIPWVQYREGLAAISGLAGVVCCIIGALSQVDLG